MSAFLDAYIETFSACGRGERDAAAVLEFYAPPVLLSTDDVCGVLADEGDVLAWAQGQIDGMLAGDFDRIEILDRKAERLNATTELVRGSFTRRRRDGSEISSLTASYLVTTRPEGARIAALMVHSPLQ